jgi:hypothetical protein
MTAPAQIDARPDVQILVRDGSDPRCVYRTSFEKSHVRFAHYTHPLCPYFDSSSFGFQAAWLWTEGGSRLPRERFQKGLLF